MFYLNKFDVYFCTRIRKLKNRQILTLSLFQQNGKYSFIYVQSDKRHPASMIIIFNPGDSKSTVTF